MAAMKDAPFIDREDAARKLVPLLISYKNNPNAVVLGLPSSGVVIAKHIAQELSLPLDVIVVKKVSVSTNVEFAVGAVTEDGASYFDWSLIKNLDVSKKYIDNATKENFAEAKRRSDAYRRAIPIKDLHGKIAIVVDDGITTGATMQAAISAVEGRGAKKIVIAAPVASKESLKSISKEITEVACPVFREPFWAVDEFYSHFPKVEDGDIIALLQNSNKSIAH